RGSEKGVELYARAKQAWSRRNPMTRRSIFGMLAAAALSTTHSNSRASRGWVIRRQNISLARIAGVLARIGPERQLYIVDCALQFGPESEWEPFQLPSEAFNPGTITVKNSFRMVPIARGWRV